MRYIVLLLSFIAIVFFLNSCRGSKKLVLESYQGPKLIFGSGGGFAGTSSSRILLPNGQVFLKGNRSKKFSECESIDKKQAEQMFKNYKALGLDKVGLNDPGNMTFFIAMEENGERQDIIWGGGNSRLDPNIKKFFNTLGQLTNNKQAIK